MAIAYGIFPSSCGPKLLDRMLAIDTGGKPLNPCECAGFLIGTWDERGYVPAAGRLEGL